MASSQWRLFALGVLLSAVCVHANDTRGTRFRSTDTPQHIESSATFFSARSRLDCAGGCKKYPDCVSFSFDTAAKVCFLLPVRFSSENGSPSPNSSPSSSLVLKIFEILIKPSAPECPTSDLESISNAGFVTRLAMPSFYADVTCDDDFTLGDGVDGSDSPRHKMVTLTCMEATLEWNPLPSDVECKQSVWRDPVTDPSFLLPRVLTTNWSMCIEGRVVNPTGTIQAGMWNQLEPVVSPFRFTFNFTRSEICLDSKPNAAGDWKFCEQTYPLPGLAAGTVFRLKVTAVESAVVSVAVDDVELGKFTTPIALFPSKGGYTKPTIRVEWLLVDMWC